MNKQMRTKLVEILKFLISIEESSGKSNVPTLTKYIDIIEDISVHENDCFIGLPDNMMFGKRGEKYMLNTSELTSAASILRGIVKSLSSNNQGLFLSEDIHKTRMAVKRCIDR